MERPGPKADRPAAYRSGRQEGLSELVGLAYESASAPDGWAVFLERVAEALRSTAPALNLLGKERGPGTLWIWPGCDPEWLRRYEEYFLPRDLRRQRINASIPEGAIFVGHEILPDEELLRSEFYNDFLRPQGFFHIMGGVPIKEPERMAVIRFIRSRRAKPFAERDKRLLGTLMPHLSRALRLHWEFAGLRAERDGARDALNQLREGVILLDRQGEVLATNERARRILERGDGLLPCDGRLSASDPGEQARLDRALETAHAGDGGTGATLLISRPSGGRPLSLRVERLAGGVVDLVTKRAVIAVFIDDSVGDALPSVEVVSDTLGLTAQQARLVVALAAGRRLKEIAAGLGITYQTARTHLANIRKRTGAHSQKDVVRLVLSAARDEP